MKATVFVFRQKQYQKLIENKEYDEARSAGSSRDRALERAAHLSTVYSVLCK